MRCHLKRGNAVVSTRLSIRVAEGQVEKWNIGAMSRADQEQRHTCQFHILVSVIVRRGRAAYLTT